jgi:hypothetical protein
MEYSGTGGKLINEKNQKKKISWHCPFNMIRGGKDGQTVAGGSYIKFRQSKVISVSWVRRKESTTLLYVKVTPWHYLVLMKVLYK